MDWDKQAELQGFGHVDDPIFPMLEVNPAVEAKQALDLWRAEQDLPPKERSAPRPGEIYRKWSKRLRGQGTPEAHEMLRKLMLETTIPANELETPDFVDGYTGEVLPSLKEQLKNIDKIEDDEEAEIAIGNAYTVTDPWQLYLVTAVRQAYADPDVAAKAMAASSEWVGVEDEEYVLEDRGREPDFVETVFTTENLPALRAEAWRAGEMLRAEIRRQLEIGGDAINERVRSSKAAGAFLALCQEMIDRGEELQDVHALVVPFMHSMGLDERDLRKLKTHDAKGNMGEWDAEYGDLVNQIEEGGPMAHVAIGQDEMMEIADRFLEELVEATPIEGDMGYRVVRSRYYVDGFIRAQINGSEQPSLEAWRYWRKKTSLEGSVAYDEELRRSGKRKRAMAAFWRKAIECGDVKGKPKTITAIQPSGLKLSDGRKVSWSTAAKIAGAEGFEDTERLVAILKEKGWGPALVQMLDPSERIGVFELG